ncbi:hypothetical protein LTR28_006045 [Elasticomyces elasticus]|nr:hypothetical protein LTR28_006045 [Elasticomyces elasticus]
MLDTFEILTTSGVVLWSKTYASISPNIINSLINDIFIEERGPSASNAAEDTTAARNPPYKKDKYTLKWSTAKDLVRTLFVKRYGKELKSSKLNIVDCRDFDETFDALVHRLDKTAGEPRQYEPDTSAIELTPSSSSAGTEDGMDEPPPLPLPSFKKRSYTTNSIVLHGVDNSTAATRPPYSDTNSIDATPIPTPDNSRPTTPAASRLLTAKGGPGGRGSRRSRKVGVSAPVSSGDESPARRPNSKAGAGKAKRRWDVDGFAAGDNDDTVLDYSAPRVSGVDGIADESRAGAVEEIKPESFGSRTRKGEFVLKDLEDEVDAILASSKGNKENKDTRTGLVESGLGALSGLFRNVVGGKTLTKEDLVKPMKAMEDHLLQKNVAREAAVRLCESVERDLIGMKTGNFTSIDATIRASMSTALTKILTPTTSLDLLRAITATISPPSPRPYVISVVGVNGVGKSTSLSKLAFFLLQNNFRVLIVAADTFRSGAVEQLGVHVRNLKELTKREGRGEVDLFSRGYGKDAANVAKEAVSFAKDNAWDVVLIDTAGRRHNDTRLMSSLTKFGQLANPDKIFMVGEALVGTDSVAQARNFSAQFVGRGLDGFVISKCDTVGDMVGTLVSMVHATGIPVVFLGVGQHYGDLRGLNVGWAVDKLLK